MPNRLIHETSPYLLQHAHNPVDWYPWGPEALQRAQAENKPILLSIGYSACHWCHVMERESFENDDIAALMNRHFINIKVDREERPDLDAVYMEAVQLLTGSGGWPMTVFLTPDGKPFYGGTYFPPTDRANMPGFPRLLEAISRSYFNSPAEIERVTGQLTEQMGRTGHLARSDAPLSADILHRAYSALATNFDYQNGGTGGAPKFPQAMTLEVLLRYHAQGHNPRAMEMLHLTLEKMARGGIYDQLGGGFHRYSVDAYWLVPHFEKMLYDNALLARLYLHAWLASGRALYRRIAEETLDYILREMTGPPGGFYSATDADSEGVEGKFFVWSLDEIEETLGGEEGPVFAAFFGVTPGGNFEGSNILNIPRKAAVFAGQHNLPMQRLVDVIQRGKETLRRRRAARIPPLLDDKVLASWNGLMLKALAEAGAAWQRGDYLDAAARNAAVAVDFGESGVDAHPHIPPQFAGRAAERRRLPKDDAVVEHARLRPAGVGGGSEGRGGGRFGGVGGGVRIPVRCAIGGNDAAAVAGPIPGAAVPGAGRQQQRQQQQQRRRQQQQRPPQFV